jgi:hypothetical protein
VISVVLASAWFVGVSPTASSASGVVPAVSDPVIAAAGDIACDPADPNLNGGAGTGNECEQGATASLLVNHGYSAVLSLGDNQYFCGSLSAYQQVYDSSWGKVKSITHPVPGNHEYLTSGGTGCDQSNLNGAGYFDYFGSAAGSPSGGYYSFNIGAWHLIALNSNCGDAGGCNAGSPQGQWLAKDLAAHESQCILAYWHIPLFSSGGRASPNTQSLWQELYAAGADLVLNGHDHIYERFAPQDPAGAPDPVNGITQITVGTGGANHTSLATLAANSIVTNTDSFGILAVTLHQASFSWKFIHATGSFTDSGTASCHNAVAGATATPAATPTPTPTPTPAPTVPGAPTSVEATAGDGLAQVSWSAPSKNGGLPISGYAVTSSPASMGCTTTTTACTVSGLANGIPYTFTVTASNSIGAGPPSPPSNAVVSTSPGSTFVPIAPVRLVDSRIGTGLPAPLQSHVAAAFQVTGGVVPAGATAVSGNLTVTEQTSEGFLYLGPAPVDNPTSSTLNFPVGDDRANAVTVALSHSGSLSVTYAAPTLAADAQVLFDVSGYFMPNATGATFHALDPARVLDTRSGLGGIAGGLASHVARTFALPAGILPANATAVTGNLTVTEQTSPGFLYLGPAAVDDPTSSTLNFPVRDDRANAVTVALGTGQTLGVTYAAPTLGPTAQAIFDLTGYFTPGSSGASYVAITPARILDTRNGTGLASALQSHVDEGFAVAGRGGVAANATAVTGNLTVTVQTDIGFLFVGPAPMDNPTSSTLNFPLGDDRANAATVALGSGGSLYVTYAAPVLGPTTQAIFDVGGYYVP